ncbi:allophanate hydrolase subunit 1 [Caballeronia glebae]|uniref:Allophanate hydrolase subunit 1 n=2 Tax=Caballeronia glebae TaxID=1777143 RepID=A0A158AZT7_9BURK|nr:allophanate hydrolase subunit 1 [Caballeronia glebae]
MLDGGLEQTADSQSHVWGVAAEVESWPEVREVSIGINNLMVLFDPLSVDFEKLKERLLCAWRETPPLVRAGRTVEIAVKYGGDNGIDLRSVAKETGLSARDVVDLHSGSEYVVQALGAHPGYPYLFGLDSRLSVPRRASPRACVPVGSVVIAGKQAGIITCASASGWHILGKASLPFFDPNRESPALLAPGDRVTFVVETVEL